MLAFVMDNIDPVVGLVVVAGVVVVVLVVVVVVVVVLRVAAWQTLLIQHVVIADSISYSNKKFSCCYDSRSYCVRRKV